VNKSATKCTLYNSTHSHVLRPPGAEGSAVTLIVFGRLAIILHSQMSCSLYVVSGSNKTQHTILIHVHVYFINVHQCSASKVDRSSSRDRHVF